MWFILAILSAVIFGFCTFLFKYNSFKKWPLLPFFFGVYLSGTIAFFINALVEGTLMISIPILIAGIFVGGGSTFGNYFFMKALDYGPASLTSPIVNTNIVLIVFMSLLVYGERISVLDYIAITLIIIAISILPLDRKEKIWVPNKIWYVLVLLATSLFFFRNGGLKITEEMLLPNTPILMIGYLLGAVWALGAHWKTKKEPREQNWKGFSFGLVTGVFSYGGMQLYALALTSGPASIISPIFASNSLIVALLSILYLKERLSLLQTLVLVSVLLGMVLLNI